MARLTLVAIAAAVAAADGSSHRTPEFVAAGLVSTGDSESHATLSPDGRSLYFVKLSPDFTRWTVVVSDRTGESWGEPAVASFSGRWDDADVSFSPDGSTLYFISNRPDGDTGPPRRDHDLFLVRRTADGWGPAERLPGLSSPGNEWFPNQARNGTLYFGSERRDGNLGPDGTSDLWRARWLGDRFGEPENLGPVINTADQEIEPWIAPDESYLVFAAKGRPGSLGSYDFYVSFQCGESWSEPQPLGGGVNSPGWDFGGRFSPDGATFFLGSNRTRQPLTAGEPLRGRAGYGRLLERLRSPGNGLFDIYAVDSAALGLTSPCASRGERTGGRNKDRDGRSMNDTDAQIVAALDTEYQAAVGRNDAATMDRILADDFVLVLGNGSVQTKPELLQEAREGRIVWEQQTEVDDSQKVRVWGDTAVVTAKLWVKGSQDGKAFDRKLWFSDTYVRTQSGWRYAFGQASLPLPREP
jgi:ketosteroid isomerase-like protein